MWYQLVAYNYFLVCIKDYGVDIFVFYDYPHICDFTDQIICNVFIVFTTFLKSPSLAQ